MKQTPVSLSSKRHSAVNVQDSVWRGQQGKKNLNERRYFTKQIIGMGSRDYLHHKVKPMQLCLFFPVSGSRQIPEHSYFKRSAVVPYR
tara:strand:- start:205 stop:468 length:264 start_codon:yes stop_codon:yes gene_type:complete